MTTDATEINGDRKYWYNLKTGQVEYGMISQSFDRAGPFDTEAEAARAPQVIADRSHQWQTEEDLEQQWGTPEGAAAKAKRAADALEALKRAAEGSDPA